MTKNAVYPNEPLRAVMDKYQIRVIETNEKEFSWNAIPEDFDYRGDMLEVRMGEQTVFCRFEGIAQIGYDKEDLLPRFPDWEGWLLHALLYEAGEARWYEEHDYDMLDGRLGGIKGWLYAYGDFRNSSQSDHEWKYACRAMANLENFFGETILKEIQEAIDACTWDTDDLD